jgi:hypothetical protein
MNEYKGLKIGDRIDVPYTEFDLFFHDDIVITSFSSEHDIVHWSAIGYFGGRCHSGTKFENVIKL